MQSRYQNEKCNPNQTLWLPVAHDSGLTGLNLEMLHLYYKKMTKN
jgi:hypothetical protein